jgi:hypothetical protein
VALFQGLFTQVAEKLSDATSDILFVVASDLYLDSLPRSNPERQDAEH